MSGNYDYSGASQSMFDNLKNNFGIDYTYIENPGLREWSGDQVPIYDGQVFTLKNSKGQNLYQGVGPEGLREATRLSSDLGGGWTINGSMPQQSIQFNEEWFTKGKGKTSDPAAEKAKIALDNGITYASREASDFDPAFLLGALPFAAAVAAPAIGAALGGGGGAGAGAAGAAGAGGAAGTAGLGAAALPAFEGITVLGGTAGGLGAAGAAGLGAAAAGGAAALGGGGGAGAGGFDGITVTGAPQPPPGFGIADFGGLSAAGAAGLAGGSPAPTPETVGTNTIEVSGDAPQPPALDLGLPIDLAALGAAATVPLASGAGAVTEPAPGKSTMDKIVDYLQIAGLGTGLLGNLLGGGGGSGGNGTVPGGLGGDLDPIFSKPLPAPSGPAANLGQRTMSAQDWSRYGTRPEQSFFNAVPQGYTPPAPGVLDPQWDKERGFAKGGPVSIFDSLSVLPSQRGEFDEDFAVRGAPGKLEPRRLNMDEMLRDDPVGRKRSRDAGIKERQIQEQLNREYQLDARVMPPDALQRKWAWWFESLKDPHGFAVGGGVRGAGTGRSDSIKARLSDGEYVVDAETVALLGDGSSKAGADKLDDFRINLRKSKGRDLAKGKFSVEAKSPERYMAGGK